MQEGEQVHTCHAECPCHTGGEPAPDFTPGETRSSYLDALERAYHYQTLALRYEEALLLIADPEWNVVSKKCRRVAREALDG